LGALVAVVCPQLAAAQQLDSGSTAWMLTSTALVLLMTLPGLALFYGGLVRTRNVLSVLMQCFALCCVISLIWVAFGYSLTFAEGNGLIGGLSKMWLRGVEVDTVSGAIPETVFAMFQLTFAIITPALIVGGFAERTRFAAMLLFSVLWLVVVYIPVAHWVWASDGWLFTRDVPFRDFAGGAVVHVNAGVAALVAAIVIKNRTGFPTTAMPPHNVTMTVIGASLLWVGWFGFNAGSALTAGGAAGMAMLVTHVGAAAGATAWMTIEWLKFGKPSVLGIVTGMVAGLGTITPASGFVGPMGALVIGLVAGVVCFFATQFIKRKLKIDDSLDVFPVHGVGGFTGLMLTAVFSATQLDGLGLPDGVSIGAQLVTQLLGAGATILWCGVGTFVILKLVNIVSPLRVTAEQENEGLDLVLHGESGYSL
jgi:Amt family ammonium transporter